MGVANIFSCYIDLSNCIIFSEQSDSYEGDNTYYVFDRDGEVN